MLISNFSKTQTFPGEITITGAMIKVSPNAGNGDIMVRINGTGPANSVEPEQICIATVKQPVLVNANASVVIDNDSNARPQAGLNEAEIVYETAVAPGVTRFLALFDLAKNVYKIGPVSNACKHFVKLASSHVGGLAHVGGSSDSLDLISEASIVSLDKTDGADKYFFLSPDKKAPHNNYTNTDLLRQGMQDKGAILVAPSTELPIGSMTGGSTAHEVTVRFPEQTHDVVFKWNQVNQYYERYENNETFVLENDQLVTANNVVVVIAEHERIYKENLDEWQVQPVLKGYGPAFFHKDGKVWEGEWNNDSTDSLIEFIVGKSNMLFDPGNTFILVIEDNDSPVIESTDPGDGAAGISNDGVIMVSFNERIQAAGSFSGVKVKDDEGDLVDVSVSIDDRDLIIDPANNFGYNTLYTVTVPADAVEDLIGNPLIGEYVFSFTTGSGPNTGGGPGGGGSATPKENSDDEENSDKDEVIEKPKKEDTVIELNIGRVDAGVNGSPYTLNAKPYVDSVTDRTLVPLRFVSEALGARVDWVATTKNIIIKDGKTEITLTLGSKEVLINNDTMVMDCAPELLPPGRSFVPLRFLSEALGAKVSYKPESRQITIIK